MSMGSGGPESGRLLLGEAASGGCGAKCFSGVEIYIYICLYIHTPQAQQVPLVSVAISVLSGGKHTTTAAMEENIDQATATVQRVAGSS